MSGPRGRTSPGVPPVRTSGDGLQVRRTHGIRFPSAGRRAVEGRRGQHPPDRCEAVLRERRRERRPPVPDDRSVPADAWNLAISTVRAFVLSTISRMAALIRTRGSRTTALARGVPSTLRSASSDAALSPSRTSATSSIQPWYSVLSLSHSWSSSILRARPPERLETGTWDRDRGHGHPDAQGPQPGREFFCVVGRHEQDGLTDPRDAAPVDESGLVSGP